MNTSSRPHSAPRLAKRRTGPARRFTADLPADLHMRLKLAAFHADTDMVDIARTAISALLDELENPEPNSALNALYESGRLAGIAEAQAMLATMTNPTATEEAPKPEPATVPVGRKGLPTKPPVARRM